MPSSKALSTFLFVCFNCLLLGKLCAQVSPQSAEEQAPKSFFEQVAIGDVSNAEHIRTYLETRFLAGQDNGKHLELTTTRKSLGGYHYQFNQTLAGVVIYGAQIKANTDFKGHIVSIFDRSYPNPPLPTSNFPEGLVVRAYLSALKVELSMVETKQIWWPVNGDLEAAMLIEWASEAGAFQEVVLDANGKLLFQRDRLVYSHAINAVDTPATAMVFSPDPLSTAGVGYGFPYIDSNDTDVAVLNNERVSVVLDVTYDTNNSLYVLENEFVKITDHNSPNIPPASSVSPDFNFTRAEDGFEDVMVFHHLTQYQLWVQNLGFTNLANFAIHADAHGYQADQSNFNASATPPRLSFGEGGVDDAEDSDVIIHEYGHAISNSAAPNTNLGTQRSTLDEALGDYLAASYSRSLNSFDYLNVFNWDGQNEFWSGRKAISSKHYPEDLINNLYSDADIWTATIMQIQDDIGREKADRLLMESLFGYTGHMTMSQAALLYVQADQLLYGGAHRTQICERFNQRGLLDFCTVGLTEEESQQIAELRNSEGFAMRGEAAELHFGLSVSGQYRIYDLQGRMVREISWDSAQFVVVPPLELSAGSYLLSASWNQGTQSFKLLVQP